MTNPTDTYTLYGAPASLYTGKARCYLRKQGINFVEVSPGSDRYLNEIVPVVGRWIIPVLETPDGEVIQDGASIIDHFEKGSGQAHVRHPAYPESPVLLAISHVFEMFGGEGLLRPAMHYRWNFDEQNLAFLTSEFALMMPNGLSEEQATAAFMKSSGRMRKAGVAFGATPESAPLIEASFGEWLDLFNAHLADHPYLLGGVPTLGDYGLSAAMWAHLFRDPAPQSLIKQRAPRVGRWVERMIVAEPYQHEYDVASGLISDEEIPDTLVAMLRYVSEEWVPEITAHVETANEWLIANPDIEAGTNGLENPATRGLTSGRGTPGGGTSTFEWRGIELTTGVMPYRFWLLQRLQDAVDAADATPRAQVHSLFAETGLASLLDSRTIRRVERADSLEVWGPLL